MKNWHGKRHREEKSRREKMIEEKESEERRCRCAKNVGKSRNTIFFQWFEAPEGRKVGSLKRRVRSQLARWEMKNCTPLWREAYFEVKMYKTHHVRTTFGSWDVEKINAVVARSTFRSQNIQNTTCSCHFWRFRCRFASQVQGIVNLLKSKQIVRVFLLFSTTTTTIPHYTTISYTTTTTTPSLHYTTLHYIQLHSITRNYTTLNYTTLRYTTLRYTTLHYTLYSTTIHCNTLHSTTLHYTLLHYITLHSTTLHYTPLRYTTTTLQLHDAIIHYTTFHYTPLHYT